MLITQITGHDTTRYLYTCNIAGGQLCVYKVEDGAVATATNYRLGIAPNGLYLYSKSLLPGQLTPDTMHIGFRDAQQTVVINRHDSYHLFPAYYVKFKSAVYARHSITTLLHLLADAIGDYPLQDLLPLAAFTPASGPGVMDAQISTTRSQANMQDTWAVHYHYIKTQLRDLQAANGGEIRYTKTVIDKPNGTLVRTFRNIENRQVTHAILRYKNALPNQIQLQEQVEEIGKNRETNQSTTLTRHTFRWAGKSTLSPADVLHILKAQTTDKNIEQ